jgi:hypothetical protein
LIFHPNLDGTLTTIFNVLKNGGGLQQRSGLLNQNLLS